MTIQSLIVSDLFSCVSSVNGRQTLPRISHFNAPNLSHYPPDFSHYPPNLSPESPNLSH